MHGRLHCALTTLLLCCAGATYPVDLQDAAALDPDTDVSRLPQANVAGEDPYELLQQEPSAPAGNARRLAKAATFPLVASIEMV